jgi:PAS domain S-box-containing protein
VNALERKRADKALRESEERLSLATDSAGAGLWSMKIDTSLVSVSTRMRELFGFTEDEELRYDSFLKVIHPEDREKVHLCVDQAVRARGELDIEYRITLPDGTIRWIAARGRLHRASSGEEERLIGLSVDITERKHAEEARLESMERYHAIVDAFDGLLYICSQDYRVEFMNQRMIERTGRNAVGELCYKALHDGDSVCEWCVNERVFRGETVRWEVQSPKDHRWYYVVNTPIRHADGTTSKQSMIMDITERKRMEQQLHDRLREIEELKQRLERENVYLRQEARLFFEHGDIIGSSKALTTVLGQAEQVAPTDSTVLLLGETGTGKELIAQAIHSHSRRKDRVMLKVDCASLPAALIESELFGREKGAYTGALTKQAGRFELADGSTIFLDEIAELPFEVQAKLLRVLQDGEFERLGSPRKITVDVRVIDATNRDLAEAVKKGAFREDLYYRLNVFPIRVPPLRERPEDIPLLVQAFVKEFSGTMGKKIRIVPRRNIEALQRYHWPGNIRELRNVIEQAVIISDSDILKINLPLEAASSPLAFLTLEEAEYMHIVETLEKTGWRIKGPRGAAALLGLKPSTLYTRMSKLNIPTRREKDDMPT